MAEQIDLRRLADTSGPDRCFLSLYVNTATSWRWVEQQLGSYRDQLEPGGDELVNFDKTVAMVRDQLAKGMPASGSKAVFACWLDDFFEAHELDVELRPKVVLDSSPFVRPLAEFLDEFETFGVVFLDHKDARIYLVTGASIAQMDRARGDIKNHVRKGGWSQQRYERRRDKQILHYCKEIADRLEELVKEEPFDRLLIMGDKVLIKELQGHLSSAMQQRVSAAEPLAAGLSESELLEAVMPHFVEGERAAERALYEEIREECFHGGRAATGVESVLAALEVGRVDQLLVDRSLHLAGVRCKSCDHLGLEVVERCGSCGGEAFEVDLVNELVELATKTGARVEFADQLDGLTRWGHLAALLRY